MDRRTLSRILSGVILSLFFAYAVYQSAFANFAMGKVHYLAIEAARYDASYSSSPQLGSSALPFLTAIGYFGIYELLAFGIYKIINWHSENQSG